MAALSLGFSGCSTPPPVPAPAADAPMDAAVGGATGRFVGSDACRACHTREYDAWSGSRHRATLRRWMPGQPLRHAAPTEASAYRVAADGSAVGPGADGRELTGKVEFLMGGRHREDAIVRLPDGRLQVFPLAFDVDTEKTFEPLRELAGGVRPPVNVVDFWTRVGRNADLACYGCHATGQTVEVSGRSPSGLALPGSKWIEPGVGCEACHGPGGPHVDAARAGSRERVKLGMHRGGGSESVDACAACHALRDVLPSPFGRSPAHRYGEPLSVAAEPLLAVGANAEFRDPFFADLRPSTYQQEAVAFSQSGCARKGGMVCAACHDVHSGALDAKIAAPDGGASVCAPCHASVTSQADAHSGHRTGQPGGRCLDCHMAPIVRGPGHEPARDHTMTPPVAHPGQVPAACAACHAGKAGADRVAAAFKRRPQGTASKRRLELGAAIDAANAASPGAAATLSRLAGDGDRGWFVRWALLQKLSQATLSAERLELLGPVRSALTDPNPALRRAAARALGRWGQPQDMIALDRATGDADPWTALESVHAIGLLGSPAAGARLLQLLKRPDLIGDARGQYQYGHACLVGGDYPRAETALRRALELNPMIVGAINDLGLALVAQDKRDEAAAAWRRALDINPRFSAAQRNLEAAKIPSAPSKEP